MTPAVIELRQYTLEPGRREAFTALFERKFVETQEAVGMRLVGQFHDLDDPDRFVWLRGFPDMTARQGALETFYYGPVWRAHREAANAEIIDSDDVLLLRPAAAGSGFAPMEGAPAASESGIVLAGVHGLTNAGDPHLRAALTAAGLHPLAVLVTEPAENTFPRLPVRTGVAVLVWFAAAADEAVANAALASLEFPQGMGRRLQTLRLSPTPRSRLRGAPIGG